MNRLNNYNIYDDSDEFYKLVSKNVKQHRKNIGESQLEFANNIGFNSVSFYCDCENNKYDKHFNLEHLYKISKFFSVDIRELI